MVPSVELKAEIERYRGSSVPCDIALGGGPRGLDLEAERAMIRDVAAAGATWWMEYVPPGDPEAMRTLISQGPLRID